MACQIKVDRSLNTAAVRQAAEAELYEERFREAVRLTKDRLCRRRWWHRLFPWVVTINRRT
jgi:hypothetical protein